MINLRNVTIGLSMAFMLTACIYQPYDAKSPKEYAQFWCQPENIKNSLAYQLANQHPNNHVMQPPAPQPRGISDCDIVQLKSAQKTSTH
ncbi:MAG: hypothetical protein HRU25_16505 [Psychrobium sp.]|nr:hypothetical protein [Psychrobium sp.]